MDLPSNWIRLPPPFTRYAADKDGNIYKVNGPRPRLMKPRPKKKTKPAQKGDPRPMLTLSSDDPGPGGKLDRETQQLGYWILLAWKGDPKTGYEASHLNGICTDNRLVNLKWETKAKNRKRRYANGKSDGTLNPNSSFTHNDTINDIRDLYLFGKCSVEMLAHKYSVSERTIYRIVSAQTYADAPEAA